MNILQRQKGFLAIVAVLLVVILAFIAVTATYQFTGDALSSANHLKSAQAFYAAEGGLIKAKNAIVTGTSCAGYSSGTVSLGQGQYSVTGAPNLSSDTVNGALTAAATTIPLASTAGFTSSGVIGIDSEFITYTGISGNSLTGATRGVSGTVAAAHASGAAVVQNECILTSTGGVPTIASPLGKRTLQMVLPGAGFSLGLNGSSASGFIIPALAAVATINISGGSIVNPVVTSTSPSFPDSTAFSGANVVINNPGQTQISNLLGSLAVSSLPGTMLADVEQNSTVINTANLWGKYFTQSQAAFQAAANQSYTSANINGAVGQTIWVSSYLDIGGNVTVGSPTQPVILVVNNNFNMTGNATVYGFVYVGATFGLAMQGNAKIIGAIAVNGPVNMNASNPTITMNPTILGLLNILNSNTKVTYSGDQVSLQEVFP